MATDDGMQDYVGGRLMRPTFVKLATINHANAEVNERNAKMNATNARRNHLFAWYNLGAATFNLVLMLFWVSKLIWGW